MGAGEILKDGSEEKRLTEAEEVLGSEPSFEEHLKRTKADRVQRFIELMNNRMSDENKQEAGEDINNALNKMSPEAALNFLQHINSQLRNDKITRKSEIYGDQYHRMVVGTRSIIGGEKELVAPEPDLQKQLFGEYLDAIKKIDDKDKRALLAYYAINNLHLFSDGNGRTSRAVFALIKNGSLSGLDDIVSHNNEIKIKFNDSDDGDDGFGRKKFISESGIRPVEQINIAANMFLQEQMARDGMLDDNFKDKHIYIYSVREKDGLAFVMMSKKNREGLSREESICLNYAMSDGIGGGNYSTLSGLTMATILQQKGLSEVFTKRNSRQNNLLPIRVNFDEEDSSDQINEIKNVFTEWTPIDYKRTIEVYRDLKKQQNEMVMRFFTDDIKFDGGKSVVDWAMGK